MFVKLSGDKWVNAEYIEWIERNKFVVAGDNRVWYVSTVGGELHRLTQAELDDLLRAMTLIDAYQEQI